MSAISTDSVISSIDDALSRIDNALAGLADPKSAVCLANEVIRRSQVEIETVRTSLLFETTHGRDSASSGTAFVAGIFSGFLLNEAFHRGHRR